MSQELVRITVDGKEVEVPKGMLLVEAAKLADTEIPVFCHHPKLDPAGVCRMCLVEVEGQRKPVTACTMPVNDGMVVNTKTKTVENLQRGVLELLLLNHPLDCPVCDKGGECPLQDQTYTYGPTVSRSIDAKNRKEKAVDLGNFIVLDRERCVLCRRCTRFDDEITQESRLVIGERAEDVVVTTADGERFNSYFSGNTIELCPVGALTSEAYRFKARPWDLAKVPSVCTACSVGCNTRLDYRFEELMRVQSRENGATDNGWLCDRGRFNYKYVQSEQRVQSPMMRKDGELVPVTWRVALREIAQRLETALQDNGGQSIGVIGGGRLTNEEAYLLQKLARTALRTNNVDYRVGYQTVASFGAYDARQTDVNDCDAVVIVDTLVDERAPVLDLRIRRVAERGGARLITVGSVSGEYRPEKQIIPALPGEVHEALQGDALREALQDAKKVVFIWGGHDAAIGEALHTLLADLTKQKVDARLLIPGEQANSRGAEWVGMQPNLLPGGQLIASEKARQKASQLWGTEVPATEGMNTHEMMEAAGNGKLDTLLLFGANLAQTYPNAAAVQKGLAQVPFLVVVDMFMTDTAKHADVVLPAASFPAKFGTYTTMDGLIQGVEPANEPEFETWTDGQIVSGLADFLKQSLYEGDEQLENEMTELGCNVADDVFAGLASETVQAVLQDGRQYAAEDGDGFVLIPVQRLFAGGGTSAFDEEIAHVRPAHEGFIHPHDAEKLELSDGDDIEVVAGDKKLHVKARLDRHVMEGTLQVPVGLPELPVYEFIDEAKHLRVVVNRRIMEEVG